MRDAPSIDIANALLDSGAKVRAYDPVAMEVARTLMQDVVFYSEPYSMSEGCDALMVITEWNEFKHLDLVRLHDLMRQPVIFDGRNIYDPGIMKQAGFLYRGLGRGYNGDNSKSE
jgi:UDPglucose 6-dehydrogenase